MARRLARAASVPPLVYPEELPVSARRAEIRDAILANQVVVVCGETGSGKTTQLPKICLEAGRGVGGHHRPHAAATHRRARGGRAHRRGAEAAARPGASATSCASRIAAVPRA